MQEKLSTPSLSSQVETAIQNAVSTFAHAFGEQVKTNRLRLGLRQDSLALILQANGVQVSQSYISRLESGQRVDPSIQIIVSLAVLLDISLDEVIDIATRGTTHESD